METFWRGEEARKHRGRKPLKILSGFRPQFVSPTGFEPVEEGCPKPATAHAFRAIASESGHF